MTEPIRRADPSLAPAAIGAIRFWPQSANPRSSAATRIRALQIIDGLRALGHDAGMFQPGERPSVLVLAKRYDPVSLTQALELRAQSGTRLVLDLCDNHFHAESDAPQWQERAERLRRSCLAMDVVVTASATLGAVVREECGAGVRVAVVPDPLDREAASAADRRRGDTLQALRLRAFQAWCRTAPGRRLLWFGNHGAKYAGGGMEDLNRIREDLTAHHRQQPLSLLVVSNSWKRYRAESRGWAWPSLYLPWSGANFRQALRHSDIAVIPAQRNPFTLCKTNNRLATAFMEGLAVAADALPSYEEFRGMAVLDDWQAGLGALMASAEERARRTALAQDWLKQHYSQATVVRQWLDVFEALGAHNSTP